MNRIKNIALEHHFGYWFIYIAFKVYHEYVWLYPSYEELSKLEAFVIALKAQLSMMPPKLLFAYWALFILNRNENKLNYLSYLKVLLGLSVGIILYRLNVVFFTLPFAYEEIPDSQPLFTLGYITSSMVDILFASGLLVVIILFKKNRDAYKREVELEKEKAVSELQYLKLQTNPHFLFNTLNNLYALARKESETTAKGIIRLSKMMRFILYETQKENIKIEEEINLIQDYISLEKLRYGDRLSVKFLMSDISNELSIAPLLLLPIVENAFKHGASESSDDSFIHINLNIEDSILSFMVENSFEKDVESSKEQGIGLENLNKQLKLLYPSYQLNIEEENDLFRVQLKINL